jgi:hypothetical protein
MCSIEKPVQRFRCLTDSPISDHTYNNVSCMPFQISSSGGKKQVSSLFQMKSVGRFPGGYLPSQMMKSGMRRQVCELLSRYHHDSSIAFLRNSVRTTSAWLQHF